MKHLPLLLNLLLLNIFCCAQSAPLWSYQIQGIYVDASPSHRGDIYITTKGAIITGCGSDFGYSILLGSNGTFIWDHSFDTTNSCNNEISFTCIATEGNSNCFAFSTYGQNVPDTNYIVIYGRNGNLISAFPFETLIGNQQAHIGNMSDDHLYYAMFPSSVTKTDTLGNIVWVYPGHDSSSVYTALYDTVRSLVVLGTSEFSNSSDATLRIIGVDTSGTEKFVATNNLFPGVNDIPKQVWYSPGKKLFGFAISTSQYKAFGMDTSGSLLWQIILADYRDGAYDSTRNVLHYLANWSGPNKKCYKIDASSGIITDSLSIDSVTGSIKPRIEVDKYGYVYIGYPQAFTSPNAYRVDRYKPNYSFDWSGIFIDTASFVSTLVDIQINDSGYVFLENQNAHGTVVSKFIPPLINSIGNNFTPQQGIVVFPNPANSSLTIQIDENSFSVKNSEIHLLAVTGQLCKIISVLPGQKTISIPIENLPSGMYFIELAQAGKPSITKKLIIQH